MIPKLVRWEPIRDPRDRRRTVWWRGTWDGCGTAYLSVTRRGGVYCWTVRSRPGPDYVVAEGHASSLSVAQRRADGQR